MASPPVSIPLKAESATSEEYASSLRLVKSTPVNTLGGTVLPKRNVVADQQNKPDVVYAVIPDSLNDLVAKKKRYLFGVSFGEVATVSVLQLAVSRQLGSPQELVRDLIFSLFVAYTVSRDWAVEYLNLHSSSVLRHFEIDGRTVDRADPLFAKNSWVNTSKMNSSAAHLLGYLVVDNAPRGGTLAKLKAEKGTPFSDLKRKTAQGLLITELAAALSDEDKAANTKFGAEFAVLLQVVDLIFGEVGSDLDSAIAKAAKFKPAEF